jgi:hypothetical protein
MGRLHYDRSTFDIDDRVLAHLQIVITQKLRRRDGFLLTFTVTERSGETSNSIWINHSSRLHFAFTGSRHPELNSHWLEALMQSSHSTIGLDLDRVPESVPDSLSTTG